MRRRAVVLGAVAALVLGVLAWRAWWPSEDQRIRRRLQSFAADFNESTTDGLGTVARAARIGSYFTEDVVVDLGKGAPPIHGRQTLIGMASRLQPRTAAFTLELLDLNVTVDPSQTNAEVNLTAAFRRQSLATGEESVDARELSVGMTRSGGEWLVRGVKTVDAFR